MKKISEILAYLKGSLDTHSSGASARKLAAFTIIMCIVVAHGAWIKDMYIKNDFSLLSTVLVIDYSFVTACFGMTSYEKNKKNASDIAASAPTS